MTQPAAVRKVIFVDEDKCVNCHACITVCPVKYCNIDKGDHMSINGELCIACGSCIRGCHHDARIPVDDLNDFYKYSKHSKKMVAIVAPAIAASFPDTYLNLNGYLKTKGVEAFFDVSFGAELTVKSYLNYMQQNNKTVIAQPCPAIVSYIETYKPNLLPYLIPVHSPMMHTVQMIKHFYPQYLSYQILAISPCLAKAKEFEATNADVLNITFESIEKMIDDEGVDLKSYNKIEYQNPPAERAVTFSTPGGLMQTANRELNSIHKITRKIEGKDLVYEYLNNLDESIKKNVAPTLVDCLNCEFGCNKGTATSNHEQPIDITEYLVDKRNEEAINIYESRKGRKKLVENINHYWKDDIYTRDYTDRSSIVDLKTPSEKEKWEIFNSMKKYSSEEIYDCSSCGYGKCESMAKAIFNGLNKKENCHYYKSNVILEITESVSETISTLNSKFESIGNMLAIFKELKSSFSNLENAFSEQSKLIDKFDDIAKTINNVSNKTNILSLNAAIEAAKAGHVGKGFGVVASEIKKLSENTSVETKKISENAKEIQSYFNQTSDQVSTSTKQFEKASMLFFNVTDAVQEMNKAMQELSNQTNEFAIREANGIKSSKYKMEVI